MKSFDEIWRDKFNLCNLFLNVSLVMRDASFMCMGYYFVGGIIEARYPELGFHTEKSFFRTLFFFASINAVFHHGKALFFMVYEQRRRKKQLEAVNDTASLLHYQANDSLHLLELVEKENNVFKLKTTADSGRKVGLFIFKDLSCIEMNLEDKDYGKTTCHTRDFVMRSNIRNKMLEELERIGRELDDAHQKRTDRT